VAQRFEGTIAVDDDALGGRAWPASFSTAIG
jgi:hypothetical protein